GRPRGTRDRRVHGRHRRRDAGPYAGRGRREPAWLPRTPQGVARSGRNRGTGLRDTGRCEGGRDARARPSHHPEAGSMDSRRPDLVGPRRRPGAGSRAQGVVTCAPRSRAASRPRPSYSSRSLVKGDFRIGPVRVRSLDPLALGAEDAVLPIDARLVVAPTMEDLRRTKLQPRRTRPWFGQVPSRQIGAGTEFWGVREYAAGDEVRRINWKASARLDRLFTNEYEGERSGDVVIVVDARRESFVGTETDNPIEHGVRAALGIAEHVLASKNRV